MKNARKDIEVTFTDENHYEKGGYIYGRYMVYFEDGNEVTIQFRMKMRPITEEGLSFGKIKVTGIHTLQPTSIKTMKWCLELAEDNPEVIYDCYWQEKNERQN